MARATYKIEEVKKDKTISFRVPNQTYKLLEKLSLNSGQSINILTRRLLTDHIYSKYLQGNLEDLKKEKKRLEAEFKKIGAGGPDWDKLYDKKKEELEEIEDKRDEQRSKINIALEELDHLDKRIEQIKEIQGKEDFIEVLSKFKKTEVWKVPKDRGSREKYG